MWYITLMVAPKWGWFTVWPDWAIYWTLGNFLNPLAAINLSKSPTFLDNFWKGVKIYHFSSEIILGQIYRHLAIFSGRTGDFTTIKWEIGRCNKFPFLLEFKISHSRTALVVDLSLPTTKDSGSNPNFMQQLFSVNSKGGIKLN